MIFLCLIDDICVLSGFAIAMDHMPFLRTNKKKPKLHWFNTTSQNLVNQFEYPSRCIEKYSLVNFNMIFEEEKNIIDPTPLKKIKKFDKR